MNEEYLTLLVTAGFLLLAFVAFRFWVEANEARLRIMELTEENKRLKARCKKTSCSPPVTPHDAIIAAFVFGLKSAGPPSCKGRKHDSGCQQR